MRLCVWAAVAAIALARAPRLETTHTCYADGAWSDTCVYTNVCFNGSAGDMIVITDRLDDWHKPRGIPGTFAGTKLPKKITGPPAPHRLAPMYYKLTNTTFLSAAAVAEAGGSLGLGEVWVDEPVWIPSYFEELGNIWYYSTRILPLYTNTIYSERMGIPLPTQVILPTLRRRTRHSWHSEVLGLSMPPGATLITNDDGPYYGFRNGTFCFKKAILLGANMFGFPDMITAFEFRRRVYEKFQLTMAKYPAPHIVILDRVLRQPRHFSNLPDMLAITRKYGYEPEHVIINSNVTFQEQVELMARTGIFISMHGAGLMNEIFLPPGSAVIEVFPVHHKHVLYERIAHYMGVYHFKVYAREFEPDFHANHPQYKYKDCDNVPSLSISDVQKCWVLLKNSNIITPLPEFEVAFVNALDHIGTRTKLRDPTHFEMDALGDHSTPWTA